MPLAVRPGEDNVVHKVTELDDQTPDQCHCAVSHGPYQQLKAGVDYHATLTRPEVIQTNR